MDAIGKLLKQIGRDLERYPCFAYASGAGNGEQAPPPSREPVTDRLYLLYATDQGREWHRETGKPGFQKSRFVRRRCSCGWPPMRPRSGGNLIRGPVSFFQIRRVE